MARIGRRGRKAQTLAETREPTAAREHLELRWRDRLIEEPRLAAMVTGEGAGREPFHRWIQYRQGFSPALVRLFLKENASRGAKWDRCTVLDPFSGAGTTVVECARNGVRSVGIEALASLVYLTAAKWSRDFPPFPHLGAPQGWEGFAGLLSDHVHRAALMLAVGRQYTSGGRPNKGAPPLPALLSDCERMIREDLVQPMPTAGLMLHGDALDLSMVADASVAGILTSPPYLSRYDYRETAGPYERVYRYWFGVPAAARPMQVQASPDTTRSGGRRGSTHDAAGEACDWLARFGHPSTARMIEEYLADMGMVLHQCRRILSTGGTCWMVIGGARLKDVYVPADLMIAELAEAEGLRVEAVRAARDLIPSRRRFGRVGFVSPRESVVVMHKA